MKDMLKRRDIIIHKYISGYFFFFFTKFQVVSYGLQTIMGLQSWVTQLEVEHVSTYYSFCSSKAHKFSISLSTPFVFSTVILYPFIPRSLFLSPQQISAALFKAQREETALSASTFTEFRVIMMRRITNSSTMSHMTHDNLMLRICQWFGKLMVGWKFKV